MGYVYFSADLVLLGDDIVVNKRFGRGVPAIVDILAVIDYSLYRKFLERHGNNKMKTMRGIRKYYTIMVAMVCCLDSILIWLNDVSHLFIKLDSFLKDKLLFI